MVMTLLSTGTDNWEVPDTVKRHPYFVEVAGGSMADALVKLDQKLQVANDYHLITRKRTHSLFGQQVQAGEVGMYSFKGRPIVALEPGNYWNFSPSHSWRGRKDITEPFEFMGLTAAQVGQSGALVVEDPENRVFVIRNGGFVAYGSRGRFRILAVVDTLALGEECAVRENLNKTGRVLGWKREVKRQNVVVATFLNIPANNVAIVQRGNDLLLLKAGQHVITDPSTTFRAFYSLGERQVQIKTQPAYTIEGVPVVLNVNLRYRVEDPLILTRNYDDAFAALANPAQTAVNSVVSRLSYQQFMRAKKVGGDIPDTDIIPWLESFKAECLHELTEQARTYGVVVESFDVLDRELEGALGKDLERQAEQVLRNQMEATQIELQNLIKTESQKGKLAVAKVQAEQTKTEAEATYFSSTRTADAQYYDNLQKAKAVAEATRVKAEQDALNTQIMAEAAKTQAQQTRTEADAKFYAAQRVADGKYYEALQLSKAAAEASKMKADQEAQNIVVVAEAKKKEILLYAEAYAAVDADHAKRMQLEQVEVEKRRVLPAKTVYFAGGADQSAAAVGNVATGMAFQSGVNLERS